MEELISISKLASHYEVDLTFFSGLDELQLIEIHTVEEHHYIHKDKIGDLERMIRLHVELDINIEGIDTVFNLLQKIESLESELIEVKSKLRFYEGDL